MIIDLTTDLLDIEWNPETCPPPHYYIIPPMYRHQQPAIYPTAQPLDVEVPYRPQSLEDGCIDDIWTVVVDTEAYTLRSNAAIDMAIHLTF